LLELQFWNRFFTCVSQPATITGKKYKEKDEGLTVLMLLVYNHFSWPTSSLQPIHAKRKISAKKNN
jgi:hypothetical protein